MTVDGSAAGAVAVGSGGDGAGGRIGAADLADAKCDGPPTTGRVGAAFEDPAARAAAASCAGAAFDFGPGLVRVSVA